MFSNLERFRVSLLAFFLFSPSLDFSVPLLTCIVFYNTGLRHHLRCYL